MKNKEFLQNAIGSIDDDLITDAVKPIKKRRPLYIAFASAACIAIIFTSLIPLFSDDIGTDGPNYNSTSDSYLQQSSEAFTDDSSYVENMSQDENSQFRPSDESSDDSSVENSDQPSENETSNNENSENVPPDESGDVIQNVVNLWDKSDFSAFSIVYGSGANLRPVNSIAGQSNYLSDTAVKSEPIKINVDSTIKVESILADRYIIYYSDSLYPIIYDTKEDKEFNLAEKLNGESIEVEQRYLNDIFKKAEEYYPGITSAEKNRKYIRDMIVTWLYGKLFEYESASFAPDMDFLKNLDGYYIEHEKYEIYPEDPEFRRMFYDFIFKIYCELPRDEYKNIFYSAVPIWIDAERGRCIVKIADIPQYLTKYVIYNLTTDEIIDINIDDSRCFTDGCEIVFSKDGSFFTVSSPTGTINGAWPIYGGMECRLDKNDKRETVDYSGEYYVAFYINTNEFVDITDRDTENDMLGCSKAYISDNGKVIYYKVLTDKGKGNYFKCDADVWYNRLTLFDSDDDTWVFCTVKNGRTDKVKIKGRFVKLARNETVAIMERGGKYYAHLIANGGDVTDQILEGKLNLAPYEYFDVYYSDNALYKKNIFSGEVNKLTDCDSYILNSDKSFAFVYKNGDNFVTCINIATCESCRIIIDDDLCKQLFADEKAIFNMNYNETENTLTLSLYKSDDVKDNAKDVDFYALMAENRFILNQGTELGKTYNVSIDESVLEEIRQYVASMKSGQVGNDPDGERVLGITAKDKHQDVLRKLGITPPDEDYINMNGTCFVLYEDEDERIEFAIGQFLPMYDPPETFSDNCLWITYYEKDGNFITMYNLI